MARLPHVTSRNTDALSGWRRLCLALIVAAPLLLGLSPTSVLASDGESGGSDHSGKGGGGHDDGGHDDGDQQHDDKDDEDDDDRRRLEDVHDGVRKGKLKPLSQILASVRRHSPGDVVSVKLRREGDRYVYRIRMIDANGKLIRITVDAASSAIMSPR